MQESGFYQYANSGAAQGIAQFTPPTAKSFNLNVYDPFASIIAGAKYMGQFLTTFYGNIGFAVAAYNAGGGNLLYYLKNGVFLPHTDATQALTYVLKITGVPLPSWRVPGYGIIVASTAGNVLISLTAGRKWLPQNPPGSIGAKSVSFAGNGVIAAAVGENSIWARGRLAPGA
jgi:hypothetical protein